MFREFVFSTAISCLGLGFPSYLAAQHFESHWYQPRNLPGVEDAANRLQQLSSQLAPVTIDKDNFYLESGYSFESGDASKFGIRLVFRKGHAAKEGQGRWSWDSKYDSSAYTPGKDDIVSSLVYAEIGYFQIWKVPAGNGAAKWCVVPIDRLTRNNDVLCAGSEEDAQKLVDALATLVRANGGSLVPPFGMWARPGADKDTHRHVEQSGWAISDVDMEGPVAKSGLQVGDIVYRVNGKPCPGSGTFFRAFSEAAREGLEGGDVRLEVLRKNESMFLVLHYPPSEGNKKQLSQR